MKRLIPLLSLVVILPLVLVSQTTGDYRSAVSNGNWGTAATWETFNGSTWVVASSQPGAANDVTIRNGFDVVLDASGKNCKNLTVEAGATFKANLALPTSSIRYVRINGTTATINGTFGDAVTGDAIAMENANTGGTVTITGSGTFAPARLRVNSNASGATTVFDINTKFMYTGSSGTGGVALYPQTDNNTFIVNAGRTLTFVDNASIAVGSSVSGTSGQTVTYNVNGTVDLSQPNSTFNLKTVGAGKTATLTVGAAGVVNIGENLLTTLASDTGTTVITNDGTITVSGTADFSNPGSVMTGTGSFVLNGGSAINIGATAGLDAALGPIRTTTRTFPVNATYTFNNPDSNQVTGTDFPSHVTQLSIEVDTVSISKNVEVDSLVIGSAAVFTTSAADTLRVNNMGSIAGTLINKRSIITSDTLTFKNGSKYVHAVNGAGIPLGFWETGSTVELVGIAGNAPSNGNQNFYNIIWNSPSQSSNLNLGWNGNIIGGDITVVSTGGSRWQMCAPSAGNSASVTINGNITVTGGQFTSQGTGNANTTVVIDVLGNINVTGGNFSVARGSQGGTGTTTWNLHGDFSMSNATTQNSNAAGAKFVFTKEGTQTLTLGAGNTLTAFPIEVDSGTTLAMGSSVLLGSGLFTLEATAGIEVQHRAGLDSTLLNTGAITLSKAANYIFNGSEAQVPGVLLPDTVNSLTISNPMGVTIADTTKVYELNVTSGALLRVDTLAILAADTGAVEGTIWNKDSLSSGDGFVFKNGAVYEHARNSGYIPQGIWEAGSLCKVTGFTSASSLAGGGDQDFYNFEWNSPNQTANASIGLYTKAIHGNFTLTSSGSGRVYFMGGSSGTTSLHGNFIQTAGNFGINGTGSQTFDTVNCYGNVTVTGGNWSVSRGSQSSGSGTSIWNMFGDQFSLTNATTQNSNSGTGGGGARVVFAKQDTQKLVLNNVTFGGGGLPLLAANGTTLDLDTSAIQGTGPFTADSGATLLLRKAEGLNGHIATTGTVTLHPYTNYSFNGSSAQVTGMLMSAAVNNLTIDNASGVVLSKATTINGVLALKAGVFDNTIPFTLGASGSISYQGGSLLLPAVVNVVSIKEARRDANGDLIPDRLNDTVKVYGVITSPNYQTTNTSYYMQDDSAGINVFAGGTVMNFEIGDSVFVIGTVLQFNGLTEISPLAANATFFGVLKQNAVVPAPKQLTLAQFLANPEMYESQVIRIDTLYKSSGSWPAAGSSASLYLKKMSGTDSLQLRIDSDTDIDGSTEPLYPINVVGIASQFSSGATVYNNGYQVLPRDTADIWHITVTGVEENLANVPIEYKLYQNYPNPFNPTTTIKFTVAKAGMARVKIYNAIGQEVATIFNQIAEPGKYYSVQLNASHLSSGMYFSVFESENHREIKKMLLLK